jgi:hypothetical protein
MTPNKRTETSVRQQILGYFRTLLKYVVAIGD